MPRDWLSKQAWMLRHVALQAVGDVRTMLTGSAIRADCLEFRGASPRAVDSTQSRRLIDHLLGRSLYRFCSAPVFLRPTDAGLTLAGMRALLRQSVVADRTCSYVRSPRHRSTARLLRRHSPHRRAA